MLFQKDNRKIVNLRYRHLNFFDMLPDEIHLQRLVQTALNLKEDSFLKYIIRGDMS